MAELDPLTAGALSSSTMASEVRGCLRFDLCARPREDAVVAEAEGEDEAAAAEAWPVLLR